MNFLNRLFFKKNAICSETLFLIEIRRKFRRSVIILREHLFSTLIENCFNAILLMTLSWRILVDFFSIFKDLSSSVWGKWGSFRTCNRWSSIILLYLWLHTTSSFQVEWWIMLIQGLLLFIYTIFLLLLFLRLDWSECFIIGWEE